VEANLDHIVLSVRDMDAMLGFYIVVLGLAPYRVDQYHEGTVLFPSVRLNAHTIIDLLPPAMWNQGDAQAATFPNLNHFCIAIDKSHWDPLMLRLQSNDIEIDSGPMKLSGAEGDGIAIYIHDPDGNQLEIRYYE